jgi:general secretion pathway protein G
MRRRGFTLIELLVTLAILGLLASVAMPLAQVAMQRQKEADLRLALRQLRTALDDYKRAWEDNRVARKTGDSGYPPSLEVLVEGVVDAKDPAKRRLYFLRRVPRDPFADDASAAAAETWGKRSYASPANAPAEGADVYDVYSRSPGIGLNGIPYREW